MKATTKSTAPQFTEKDLPINLGTFANHLELEVKRNAARGVRGLNEIKKALLSVGVAPTERIITSICAATSFGILKTIYKEQAIAELDAAGMTLEYVRSGAIREAEGRAMEKIQALQETNVLHLHAQWVAAILKYIDWNTVTVDEDAIIDAQAHLFCSIIKTPAGLKLYNEHLDIIHRLNELSEKLSEGKASACVYDGNIGQFKPTSVDYDVAALAVE